MGQNIAQFSAGSAAVVATLVAVHGVIGPSRAESFDNRWTAVEPIRKGDRLGTPANAGPSSMVFYSDPATAMTIATKVQPGTRSESAPPPSGRKAPNENARQDKAKKLPVGCDPSFSPVTTPSMANVTGRCLAAQDPATKVAELAR
jgi:hypothetical protein